MKKRPKIQRLENFEGCSSDAARSTRELIGRIADKWGLLVVIALSRQKTNRARFSDLKQGIEGVSQTMLTSTLRSLERDGILLREVFPEVPPRVEYQLTEFGVSLLEPVQTLVKWAEMNWAKVRRSREKYDHAKGKKT